MPTGRKTIWILQIAFADDRNHQAGVLSITPFPLGWFKKILLKKERGKKLKQQRINSFLHQIDRLLWLNIKQQFLHKTTPWLKLNREWHRKRRSVSPLGSFSRSLRKKIGNLRNSFKLLFLGSLWVAQQTLVLKVMSSNPRLDSYFNFVPKIILSIALWLVAINCSY